MKSFIMLIVSAMITALYALLVVFFFFFFGGVFSALFGLIFGKKKVKDGNVYETKFTEV